MTSAAYLQASANAKRLGNMYGIDGERITALNKEGAQCPEMEVYSFPSYDALVAAQKGYSGYVTAIMLNGTHVDPWMGTKEADNGPKDYFVGQADGSFVRSNKWGAATTVLKDLKPDHSGVIATGEVTGQGTTGGTPTPQPAPVQQVANGQVIVCGIGKTFINAGSFTARLHLENGQRLSVRIAEKGDGAPAQIAYHIESGGAVTESKQPGNTIDTVIKALDFALIGMAGDGSWQVHPGDVDIVIARAMPDGVASGDVVIDVQEAR